MGIYKILGKLTTQIDSVSDIQTTQIDDIIVKGRSWPQPVAAAEEDTAAFYGGRGLWGGGFHVYGYYAYNIIQYITIDSPGNATDFGDLSGPSWGRRWALAACSNGTKGVFGGGDASNNRNIIDYVTIATTGNATDFGDLTVGRKMPAACSDGTKGVFGGGYSTKNTIDYVTIATPSNATDFGDLTVGREYPGACSDGTKGVFGGGNTPNTNVIDYITIASPANATDFGDLPHTNDYPSACSDGTKGLFANTYGSSVSIDYVTIATPSNATDFGDFFNQQSNTAACSDGTYGVWAAGGFTFIDYVTIATPSNASDFGDFPSNTKRFGWAACSGD